MNQSPQPKRLTEVTLADINQTCNDLKKLDEEKIRRLEDSRRDMKLTELAKIFGYRVKEVVLRPRAEPVDPIELGDFFSAPTGLYYDNSYGFNIQESFEVDNVYYPGGYTLATNFGPVSGSGYGNDGRIFVFENMNGPTPNPAQYEKRKKRVIYI